MKNKGISFRNDIEKMNDYKEMTREEFLKSYSYLTQEDYEATKNELYLEKIKELAEFIFDTNDRDLFVAQMLFEKCDRKQNLIDIQQCDIDFANKIYDKCYLENNNDDCSSKWNSYISDALFENIFPE